MLSEQEAQQLTNNAYLTLLRIGSGAENVGDITNLFTAQCRSTDRNYNVAGFARVLGMVGTPSLIGKNRIDGFDIGEVSLVRTNGGIRVTPRNVAQARIRLDGEWIDFDEFSLQQGSSGSDLSKKPGDRPLVFSREEGRWLIAGCE
jgi:hypothetical protein